MEDILIISDNHDSWPITVKWQILKFDTIFHLYDKSEFRHHSIVYDMKNIIIYIYAFNAFIQSRGTNMPTICQIINNWLNIVCWVLKKS